MNMVGHASGGDYLNASVVSDSDEILPERFKKFVRDSIFPFVRGPDEVNENGEVGMRHCAGRRSTRRSQECRPSGSKPNFKRIPTPWLTPMG